MYKVVKPEGAPEWFVPGIECKVRDVLSPCKRIIVWYKIKTGGRFLDSTGNYWMHAEPIESWTPKEGEWVAAWDNNWEFFSICHYFGNDGKLFDCGHRRYDRIARITDGLDLRCTPEELKERTEWL